ncbi:acyl-CoA dehydrogenase [Halobiforma lacisalsi AJ5]|uniref:Acyl-CoA dehydrogenase n=1 Tax=Natronobacterium lacisalsi AJ5 TaxID=358396 RepID=M0LP76_NATLA|nr:hypothetical protein [Halobiforma lacisalsi]APW99398.1 acyl-CoA dehydrogenase [Halobiforma lacisalsi AJ5]EMA35301.1 hypothetical protein C445_05593 [Halobiforma lacisalsi AJ5]
MPQPEIAADPAEADDDTVPDDEEPDEPLENDSPSQRAETSNDERDENTGSNNGDDVEIEEVELTDDDLADGDLFAGVDDVDDEKTENGNDDTEDESTSDNVDPDEQFTFSGDNPTAKLQTSIEDGAAKLATVGLDDEQQDALEDDLRDVFSAFRLGYYGAEFANEYILVDGNDEVDPAWALLGSSLACAAVAVAMRPDSDEQIARLKDAANLGGASA